MMVPLREDRKGSIKIGSGIEGDMNSDYLVLIPAVINSKKMFQNNAVSHWINSKWKLRKQENLLNRMFSSNPDVSYWVAPVQYWDLV